MLLQLAMFYNIHTQAAIVVCSVKCIGSRFRLLVAVHIKANKMCCGMKVVHLRYGTALTQVYTREHITLEYLEDYSHSKCESSKITQATFAH